MLAARRIWSPEIADDIGSNALQILANASRTNLRFFNAKASRSLLAGLFYILGYRFKAAKTQKEIATSLGISELSLRKSYKSWLNNFPSLFTDIAVITTRPCRGSKNGKQSTLHNGSLNGILAKANSQSFDLLLLEAIDEAFYAIGESAKTLLYSNLEKTFQIKRTDIPTRITDFAKALEKILGSGSRFLEILIMKKLHVKIGVACKWQYCKYPMTKLVVPEVDFQKYVDLMREIFEAKNKDGCTEIGVFVCE